jgi:UDP-3-O-[3-hydroxymyristoyl] glucosamine N-acyltransferase
MIDPRFYTLHGPLSLATLFPDCEIKGDGARAVTGVAPLDEAGPNDICFFEGKVGTRIETKAGAIALKRAHAENAPPGAALILAAHPREMFSAAARRLASEREFQRLGVAVSPDAKIEQGVVIGPGAVIAPDVMIGEGAQVGPNAVIGPGVRIGRRTRIGAGAVIGFALIGDDVNILANAVIGQAGFGVAGGATGPVDLPHFGRVIIEDRVTLGALTAVDRGMFADTIISEDAKIDNLCHIGHNVVVGRSVLMAAFGGISGSTKVGDGVVMGGRVGLADHLTIGPGARISAGAAVLTDVPPGETWGGYPAKPLRRFLRETAWLAKAARGKGGQGET